MSVLGVSSSSNSNVSSTVDVGSLQHQIRQLMKQIKAEMSSNDDPQTKQTVIQLLEAEIQMLQNQIQQARTRKLKQAIKVDQVPSSSVRNASKTNDINKFNTMA